MGIVCDANPKTASASLLGEGLALGEEGGGRKRNRLYLLGGVLAAAAIE